MNRDVCKHLNRVNHWAECEAAVYKARVAFTTVSKLGVVVEDEIYHIDYKHAVYWVKRMGNKIKNATIIY